MSYTPEQKERAKQIMRDVSESSTEAVPPAIAQIRVLGQIAYALIELASEPERNPVHPGCYTAMGVLHHDTTCGDYHE